MCEIKCENEFCIYYNQDKCVLDNINLDIAGNCSECIYVEVDAEYLNEERKKQFGALHNTTV